jgi:hypothetical protein
MMAIALELARGDARYLPSVHRFGQHFAIVTNVLQRTGAGGIGRWDGDEQFYFDVIRDDEIRVPLKIFSMVGLVPLFASAVVDQSKLDAVPNVMHEVENVLESRRHLKTLLPSWVETGKDGTRLLAVVDRERLRHILRRVLDETQFLSGFGVRSMSRQHHDRPYRFPVGGEQHEVRYRPGVSDNRMYGGNSNWRGPIWFPMNFLLIQSIATCARYYDDSFTVECPTGSGRYLTLSEVADELAHRLTRIVVRDKDNGGSRAVFGDNEHFQHDRHWRDYVPFHEFFDGESGAGLGASHQTGWTALVAVLLQYGGALAFERLEAGESFAVDREVA